MQLKPQAKRLLHRAGLYLLARDLYRWCSLPAPRERRANRYFYRELIRPGELCFDIGANVGQTVEELLAAGARVVAVEPNPSCFPVLEHQFAGDPRVHLVRTALGATTGAATLRFSGSESNASLRGDWPFANEQSVIVEVITLDALIGRFGPPHFLKIDV